MAEQLHHLFDLGDCFIAGNQSDTGFAHVCTLLALNRGMTGGASAAGYVQTLSNGYACELKGWTHSRKYAAGLQDLGQLHSDLLSPLSE